MAVRLITYDLRKSGQDYSGLLKAIKAYDSWEQLSESCYAIETTKRPSTVFAELSAYIDENDHLLVITLTSPYFGRHKKTVIDWCSARLTPE